MKTDGRPQSTNIQDNRAYFGSQSIGIGNVSNDQANQDFLSQSFGAAATWKGSQDWNTMHQSGDPNVATTQSSFVQQNTPKVKKGTKY